MNKKTLIILGATIVVGAIIGVVAYKTHRKKMTTSQDPDKNNRKIILVD